MSFHNFYKKYNKNNNNDISKKTFEDFYLAGRDSARKEILDCLEDEAVVCWILSKQNEGNYKQLIHEIISWNVSVALDPLVSSDARLLIQKGKLQAYQEIKNTLDKCIFEERNLKLKLK